MTGVNKRLSFVCICSGSIRRYGMYEQRFMSIRNEQIFEDFFKFVIQLELQFGQASMIHGLLVFKIN